MTVYIWDCGWPQPHAPHVYTVVHPQAPTVIHQISCVGVLPTPDPNEGQS